MFKNTENQINLSWGEGEYDGLIFVKLEIAGQPEGDNYNDSIPNVSFAMPVESLKNLLESAKPKQLAMVNEIIQNETLGENLAELDSLRRKIRNLL